VDSVAWGALALTLTVLGGAWTFYAFRNRGAASGLRGLGLTLVPVGLWLTDSLRMVSRIADAIGDWATGLVFSPMTWAGIVVFGVAALCLVVSGVLRGRQTPTTSRRSRKAAGSGGAAGSGKPLPRASSGKAAPAASSGDDELDEIEAILRKRGIS
jgi:hypothetical protein